MLNSLSIVICISLNSFSIKFRILGFGSFDIQVNAICGCECEDNAIPNSPDCTNGNGTFTCGICQCNSGR